MRCRVSYIEPEWVKKESDELIEKWMSDTTGISLKDFALKNCSKEFKEEWKYVDRLFEGEEEEEQ